MSSDNMDLSAPAIKRAVLRMAAQKPLTAYPAAIAGLGGVCVLLFDAPIIGLATLGVGGLFAVSNFIVEMQLKGSNNANEYVRSYREELIKKRNKSVQLIECDLKAICNDEGLKQIDLFTTKYDNFQHLLDRKLDPTELTYNRFMTIAEQVFLGGIDNLGHAYNALRSVSAIDIDRLNSEISELELLNDSSKEAHLETLLSRRDLRDGQHKKAALFLLENETALSQLDQVTAKLSDMNTVQGHALVELEDSMNELQHLINRAEKYAA